MSQKTFALIIALVIAVLLLVLLLSLFGPQKMIDLVNNSPVNQSITDYLP